MCINFLRNYRVVLLMESNSNAEIFNVANKIGEHAKLYSYKELQTATENFSLANKIGQGGFGSVFKVRV